MLLNGNLNSRPVKFKTSVKRMTCIVYIALTSNNNVLVKKEKLGINKFTL